MTNPIFADKDYQLWVLLLQTRDMVFTLRREELKHYGISPEEAGVLFIIQSLGENVTPTHIARWLFRKHHTVLGILSRMEKKQLIRRTKDLKRKNVVMVSLTERGQQIFYQSTEIDCIHQIMSSLSQTERQLMRSFLEKMRGRALELINTNPKPPFP